MENFDDIINWENLFKQSETFKNNKPFKFAFTEEIFKRDFYERLFETFPEYDKNDETWFTTTSFTKHLFCRRWGTNKDDYASEEDPKLSPEWNRFYRFLHSLEHTVANPFERLNNLPTSTPESSLCLVWQLVQIILYVLCVFTFRKCRTT